MNITPGNSEDFNDKDLKHIQSLSNDIYELKGFIQLLENHKDDKIKALYIVTETGYQIELKGRFSKDATNKLLELIINSRKSLITMLSSVLSDLSTHIKKDGSNDL